MNWHETLSIISAISALALSVISAIVSSKKTKSEAAKNLADAEITFQSAYKGLLVEIEALRKDLNREKELVEEFHSKHKLCEERESESKKRLARIESSIPSILLAEQLENFDSITSVLDRVSDGIVISSPVNDGTFLWVNIAFALSLQMTRDEVLNSGWKRLIHREDLDSTLSMEKRSLVEVVEGYTNKYCAKDGSIIKMVWYSSQYTPTNGKVIGRISFSVVKIFKPRVNSDDTNH